MTLNPNSLAQIRLVFLAFASSITAIAADDSILLSPKSAIELSWEIEDDPVAVAVSSDGESWRTISPTRRDGQKAYWITTLDEAPILARKTAGDSSVLKGDQLIVDIAAGVRQLKIEIFDQKTQKWKSRVLANLDGAGGAFPFSLNGRFDLSNIRVSTSEDSLFNFNFSSIAYEFGSQITEENLQALRSSTPAEFTNADSDGAAVEESDIWRVHGDRVFFFNHLRGLQVIDLSDSANPEISHFLKMPAVGQQMYVPNENLAILLASKGYSQRSEARVVAIDGNEIETLGIVEIQGQIFDSRMVGDRLYTAAYSYQRIEQNGYDYYVWDDELLITAIDLSDPENPQKLEEITLPDASAVLTATPEYLVVASRNWRWGQNQQSDVFLFSLTDPNSPLKAIQSFRVEGVIKDKFKIGIKDEVITCISEKNTFGPNRERYTVLETFAINPTDDIPLPGKESQSEADSNLEKEPVDPNRLARLVLGENETLFATRIVADRAYIVTFLQIDPLWVVDLSDPSEPTISGELEIPGWSTYLQPIGDQLFAIGVEDRRVSISFFDVGDPSNPSLSDRVFLGDEGSYTWSEGNYDEKAVTILPEQNIALIPFFEYDSETYQHTAKIQLIDFTTDTLALKGVIESDYSFRRATVVTDEIVSISNEELLVVNADDRDRPQLISHLTLAWNVDRTLETNGYLLQIDNGYSYSGSGKARIRKTSSDDPDSEIAQIAIEDSQIVGASVSGTRLYCLVSKQLTNNEGDSSEFTQQLSMKTFETSDSIIETASLVLKESPYQSFEYDAAWIGSDTFVWSIAENRQVWFRDFIRPFPHYGNSDTDYNFFAIDAADRSNPTLFSSIEVGIEPSGESERQSFFPRYFTHNPVLNLNDRFYISYQDYDQLEKSIKVTNFIREVDFNDPTEPVASDAIPIPGKLRHLNRTTTGGILLFTTNSKYEENEGRTELKNSLQASAFDGSGAFLLDEIETPAGYFDSSHFFGNTTYIPSQLSGYNWHINDPETPPTLERYTFNDSGVFETLSPIVLETPTYDLRVLDQTLYTIERDPVTAEQILRLYDAADLGPDPSLAQIELNSIHHSLRSLTEGENTLYFANGIYGTSAYSLEPQLTLASIRVAEPASDVKWSVVPSPTQITIASITSDNSGWAFADSSKTEALSVQLNGDQPSEADVSAFQVHPALEVPLNSAETGSLTFLESSNLKDWATYSGITTQSGSLLLPLENDAPLYIRVDN